MRSAAGRTGSIGEEECALPQGVLGAQGRMMRLCVGKQDFPQRSLRYLLDLY